MQEQLSVCNAKETKYEETIMKLNESIANKEKDNSLLTKIKSLTEKVNTKDELIKKQRLKLIKLTEDAKSNLNNKTTLNEQLT